MAIKQFLTGLYLDGASDSLRPIIAATTTFTTLLKNMQYITLINTRCTIQPFA